MTVRGFSLIELLIAMALLAILAGIGGRGLIAVAEGHRYLEAERQRWDGIAALFARLGDDVGQAIGRNETNAQGQRLPAWRTDPAIGLLEYSRSGPSGPLRVSWRKSGARIELALDSGDWLPVLGDVRRLEWHQLDDQGNWLPNWPGVDRLPRAVMIIVELEDGTRLERRFATP